jgi:acyl-coenzyme A thioesterase PaaI-like protein
MIEFSFQPTPSRIIVQAVIDPGDPLPQTPPEVRMKIDTHRRIDQTFCGKPIFVESGNSQVELATTPRMAADEQGLVHGGFIFGAADYAAMIAVNHPHVVLGASDVKFLKPVRVGETVMVRAQVREVKGKKYWVSVSVDKDGEEVFQGMFTCFVLDKHVLD